MNNRISTKKIALCGVLTALAMIFSYIESVIPIPIPVPGIKLGGEYSSYYNSVCARC